MPPKKRGYYTAEEVAEHNTEKSLWVIMNRKVYDVTVFHKRHPGGAAVLRQMGGRDATAAATAAHKTILPGNLMWEFCIGSIVRNKKPEPSPKATEVVPKAKALPTPSTSPPLPPPAEAPPPLVPSAEAAPVPSVAPKARSKLPPSDEAPPSPQGKVVRGKAKAKAQATVEKVETNKADEASASSGSKSVQGSVNGEENNSPQSDSDEMDTEFKSVMEFLYDKMSSDSELCRWVRKSNRNELLFEVQRFLAALLEGSDIRRSSSFNRVKRSERSPKTSKRDMKEFRIRLEKRFSDFADIMVGLMKRPFPLGEDMFVANLGILSKAIQSIDQDDDIAMESLEEFVKEKQVRAFAYSIRISDGPQDMIASRESSPTFMVPFEDSEASSPMRGLGNDVKEVEDQLRVPASVANHEASAEQAVVAAWLCNCLSDGRSAKLTEA